MKKIKVNNNTYFMYMGQAFKVSFLSTFEERVRYASALCMADEWGKKH